ncbi:MAG: iron chelate uptake ABC transporter family permease subunit [Streptosporangiales bacterium]|nr:iron chelate uptake ABC transporter family permease subunit [Streptosporangiales bacterium]
MGRWRAGGLIGLTALLCLAVLLGLVLGSRPLPVGDVVAVLAGRDAGDAAIIVLEQRLPRTLLGVVIGAALGVGGAVAQGITRNPLADPALLGVSAGAALALVVGSFVFGIATLAAQIPVASAGAALAGCLVLALGTYGRAAMTPTGLALVGLALSAMIVSIISTLVLLDAQTLDEYRYWLVGSLAGKGLSTVKVVAPLVAVGLVLAAFTVRGLDALALGDDVARGLGVRARWTRAAAGVVVVVLTGTAVAAAGPIAFVGLVVPHVARALTGPLHGWLLAYAAVLGGGLLVVADATGRVVALPNEVQVGVITALVGAPLVLVLLRRSRVTESTT